MRYYRRLTCNCRRLDLSGINGLRGADNFALHDMFTAGLAVIWKRPFFFYKSPGTIAGACMRLELMRAKLAAEVRFDGVRRSLRSVVVYGWIDLHHLYCRRALILIFRRRCANRLAVRRRLGRSA